jgi:homoserine kinase
MAPLIEAAYDAGAVGACLAGAGPSVLALCSHDPAGVAAAMKATAEELRVRGAVLRLRPRNFGSRVEVGV